MARREAGEALADIERCCNVSPALSHGCKVIHRYATAGDFLQLEVILQASDGYSWTLGRPSLAPVSHYPGGRGFYFAHTNPVNWYSTTASISQRTVFRMTQQPGSKRDAVRRPRPWCSSSSAPGPFLSDAAMNIDWIGDDWELWLLSIPILLCYLHLYVTGQLDC